MTEQIEENNIDLHDFEMIDNIVTGYLKKKFKKGTVSILCTLDDGRQIMHTIAL